MDATGSGVAIDSSKLSANACGQHVCLTLDTLAISSSLTTTAKQASIATGPTCVLQPTNVDDGNPCTVDACDTSSGVVHQPVAAGSSCSDGNACNGMEVCDASASCLAGTPPQLDDGNPCTVDSCDPNFGVQHVAASAGVSCPDGNVCNGDETCDGSGTCQPGVPLVVDDGNPCSVDACDPIAGVTHTQLASGTPCPSAGVDLCSGAPVCSDVGLCVQGPPVAVDDSNPCTLDSCDPTTGVVTHVPIDTAGCDGTPPTWPSDAVLTVVRLTSTTADLSWSSATDNSGFVTYTVSCNGTTVTASPTPQSSAHLTGLNLGATYSCSVTAADGAGNKAVGPSASFQSIPVAPSTVAPRVDPTVPTNFAAAHRFLWDSTDPTQVGVVPGAIDDSQLAIVRGLVIRPSGEPLAGAHVSVRNHPEYGYTATRADGMFDIAVNGGGTLRIDIELDGYESAQRTVSCPLEDFVWSDDSERRLQQSCRSISRLVHRYLSRHVAARRRLRCEPRDVAARAERTRDSNRFRHRRRGDG